MAIWLLLKWHSIFYPAVLAYYCLGRDDDGFLLLVAHGCAQKRLAFFAVQNTVIVLALRAMIAEFLFFICIAGICFSGLLFTLWTLENAAGTTTQLQEDKRKWTFKSISWLMVQIWFGNIYSNSQFPRSKAYDTANSVKTDALFSYQPPFNILAFVILKPASWICSPRALHSLNVLLIKTTSFPILMVIGIYERYLTKGQAFRESGKGAMQAIFNSLPRQIKNIPIVEALVGSTSSNIYEAIFDVEAEYDADLFSDSDDDTPALRSFEAVSHPSSPNSHRRPPSRREPSPLPSPRPRTISANLDVEVSSGQNRSPLAKLFVKTPPENSVIAAATSIEASVKRVETLMDELKGLPIQRVRTEIKELQDRQARIENLLLALTRGMRQSDLDRGN
ncbi:hypothetical protein D9757_001990 [Collybiopsis confluens]|uniref:Calcium channel YVC1-like C-terminal transmembrane domain-containing protein n=1 Tax=Collybiopsis confluens TaxID=2823264 RepID=A0A8H5HYA1_9AGAR|nr:hypothetical protein D9757_001990 [Collybiopsis confluens]